MKRILFSVFMVGAFTATFAQNNKVVSAFNYMKYDDELNKAKEAIDAAILHEQTSAKAKTWLYRGHVYSKIAGSALEENKTLHDNPVQVAFDSYMKLNSIDQFMTMYSVSIDICSFYVHGKLEYECYIKIKEATSNIFSFTSKFDAEQSALYNMFSSIEKQLVNNRYENN